MKFTVTVIGQPAGKDSKTAKFTRTVTVDAFNRADAAQKAAAKARA